MPLLALRVDRFRNIGSAELNPSPSLNFLYGVNGSGKTSLLEAISVLAHGRSFRTRKYTRLIQQDCNDFTVFGRVEAGGVTTAMGVARKRSGDSQFRIDGANASSSAELAAHLPLLVLNSESFGLLTGAPKQRRQFFDWLVFHVKHDFRETWRNYSRCVKQRNTLLRRDKITYSEVRPWDLEIARLSVAIERHRSACIAPLMEQFSEIADELDIGEGTVVALEYISGWKAEGDFEEQLADTFSRDRKHGYTGIGPHKGDLKITVKGVPAGDILSRGQQKSLIAALYVAEARTFSRSTSHRCTFLIDDMPAELDAANVSRVGAWINQTDAQVFVTGVEIEPLLAHWPEIRTRDSKVFHVKQGVVVTEPSLEK